MKELGQDPSLVVEQGLGIQSFEPKLAFLSTLQFALMKVLLEAQSILLGKDPTLRAQF